MGIKSHRGLSYTNKCFKALTLLTDEVGDWLEGLFLPHDEPNLLRFLVSHQLGVASASLLPLFISESVQLRSHFENALFGFLSSHFLNFGQLFLHEC